AESDAAGFSAAGFSAELCCVPGFSDTDTELVAPGTSVEVLAVSGGGVLGEFPPTGADWLAVCVFADPATVSVPRLSSPALATPAPGDAAVASLPALDGAVCCVTAAAPVCAAVVASVRPA